MPFTPGFDPSVATELCKSLNATCTWVPVYSFDGRIAAVMNGSADFSISIISVTPERQLVVDFVYPLYYSAGVELFAPNGTIDASAGWDALVGKSVCVQSGYYAIDYLTSMGIKTVIISSDMSETDAEGVVSQNIANGTCVGIINDNTASNSLGFPNTQLVPIDVAPYGIAVGKGKTDLLNALSAASVQMMNKGNESLLFKLQDQWIVPNGVPVNPSLPAVVDAISTFASSSGTTPSASPSPSTPSAPASSASAAFDLKTVLLGVVVSLLATGAAAATAA